MQLALHTHTHIYIDTKVEALSLFLFYSNLKVCEVRSFHFSILVPVSHLLLHIRNTGAKTFKFSWFMVTCKMTWLCRILNSVFPVHCLKATKRNGVKLETPLLYILSIHLAYIPIKMG